jgi:hypothetical protein
VVLSFCATLAFVILAASLAFWSLLTLGLGFLLFCYYLSEIIRELWYLYKVRKENEDVC